MAGTQTETHRKTEQKDEQHRPRDLGGVGSILAWLWVGVWALVCQLLALVVLLLGGLWWDRDRRLFHAINRLWGVGLTITLPFSMELRGAEHLPDGPFVITPNHQSVIDLLVTYRLPLPHRTVVKRSWFYSPYGLAIRLGGYIPTQRSQDPSSAAQVLAQCQTWLNKGVSILIFAEGTRSRTWRVKRFKRGPFELATTTGTAILPVAIAGSNDVHHPDGWRFAFPNHVIVEILPPIAPDGLDSHALRAACHRAVAEQVTTLREELATTRGQGPGARA